MQKVSVLKQSLRDVKHLGMHIGGFLTFKIDYERMNSLALFGLTYSHSERATANLAILEIFF